MPTEERDEITTSDGSIAYPAASWEAPLMPPNWHVKDDDQGVPRWTTM